MDQDSHIQVWESNDSQKLGEKWSSQDGVKFLQSKSSMSTVP
jgi:hypothetical protein